MNKNITLKLLEQRWSRESHVLEIENGKLEFNNILGAQYVKPTSCKF